MEWRTRAGRSQTPLREGIFGYLLMDRDGKFSPAFQEILKSEGVEPVLPPAKSPNLNAQLERFHRSIKEERLGRMIFFGEVMLRNAVLQFIEHYHGERNHKGWTIGF